MLKNILKLAIALAFFFNTSTFAALPTALPGVLESIISDRTANMGGEEKGLINRWSAARKLSEFFCQELALKELGKTYSGADRVFMSLTEQDPVPEFISENRIKGKGSVRYGANWADFSYECTVNMETGEAESFTFK